MRFSPLGAIWFGFVTLMSRPWFFAGAALILIAMSLVAAALSTVADGVTIALSDAVPWLSFLVYEDPLAEILRLLLEPSERAKASFEWTVLGDLTDWALTNYVNMGAVALSLAARDNLRAAKLSTIWAPQPYWAFLATSALTFLAVVLGVVILIVPGVIALVLFCFSPFIVIDRGLGPVAAMRESARISRGQRLRVFNLFILWLLIWVVFAALAFAALVLATVFLIQYEDLIEWGQLVFWIGSVPVAIGVLALIVLGGLSFADAYRQLSASEEPA